MTFDEWWDANEKQFTADSCHMSGYHMASVAWRAGQSAEREACAEICDETFVEPGDLQVDNCHEAAKKIRARESDYGFATAL